MNWFDTGTLIKYIDKYIPSDCLISRKIKKKYLFILAHISKTTDMNTMLESLTYWTYLAQYKNLDKITEFINDNKFLLHMCYINESGYKISELLIDSIKYFLAYDKSYSAQNCTSFDYSKEIDFNTHEYDNVLGIDDV